MIRGKMGRRLGAALGVGLGACALLIGTVHPAATHAQPGVMFYDTTGMVGVAGGVSKTPPAVTPLAPSTDVFGLTTSISAFVLTQGVTTYTQPDPSSAVQAYLPAGTVVQSLGVTTGVDGLPWEQLATLDGVSLGWIHESDFEALATPILIGNTPAFAFGVGGITLPGPLLYVAP